MANFYISAKLYFYFILRDPTQMLHFKLVANSSDLAATLANLVGKTDVNHVLWCGSNEIWCGTMARNLR